MFRAGNIEELPRRDICVFFFRRKKIFLRNCERKIRNVRDLSVSRWSNSREGERRVLTDGGSII